MQVKRYAEVAPTAYDGGRSGVTMREMITASDGAPTPDHHHPWEHEVFIVRGAGVVTSEQGDRPFAAGDTVFIAGNDRTASSPIRRCSLSA